MGVEAAGVSGVDAGAVVGVAVFCEGCVVEDGSGEDDGAAGLVGVGDALAVVGVAVGGGGLVGVGWATVGDAPPVTEMAPDCAPTDANAPLNCPDWVPESCCAVTWIGLLPAPTVLHETENSAHVPEHAFNWKAATRNEPLVQFGGDWLPQVDSGVQLPKLTEVGDTIAGL